MSLSGRIDVSISAPFTHESGKLALSIEVCGEVLEFEIITVYADGSYKLGKVIGQYTNDRRTSGTFGKNGKVAKGDTSGD